MRSRGEKKQMKADDGGGRAEMRGGSGIGVESEGQEGEGKETWGRRGKERKRFV